MAGHPEVFATFTAPSFGAVHHRVVKPDGTVQRCHPGGRLSTSATTADDPLLGQALDPDSYDYAGAVIWNALAGVLWHRTVHPRHPPPGPACSASPKRSSAAAAGSPYGKVAEFQARGVVHFHAIFRLDGPDGPDQPPPGASASRSSTAALEAAARQAVVTSPDTPATGGSREVRWGEQLDIQPITVAGSGEGELTDQKVAGYVAKYATKAAENTGTLDRPVVCWRCKGTGYDPDGTGLCKGCHGRATRHDDVHHLVDNPARPSHDLHLLDPRRPPRARGAPAATVGAHARLPRALLDPITLLLHHSHRAAPSSTAVA